MTGWTGKRGRKLKSKLEKTKQKVKSMARELYDDHFKAVESMPRGVVVTLRNISTQLESAWELHTNRQVRARAHVVADLFDPEGHSMAPESWEGPPICCTAEITSQFTLSSLLLLMMLTHTDHSN